MFWLGTPPGVLCGVLPSSLKEMVSWRVCPTGTWGAMHLRDRGSCLFGSRTGPSMGKIFISTIGICPFVCEPNPYRFGIGYTPRGIIRLPLPGDTASDYLPLPISQGVMVWVPILGNNPGIAATAPVQTLRTIWHPSKDPGTLGEHNTLPATHKWLHHSSTPWPPESDWKCIVSSFMSMTDAGKHQASLIIEHSNVTKHQDHPVSIHPSSFLSDGQDTSSTW